MALTSPISLALNACVMTPFASKRSTNGVGEVGLQFVTLGIADVELNSA